MPTLNDRFRGCLLGGLVGDVVGAVVEAESPAYIARTYRSVDDFLAAHSVAEFQGPDWPVGRFTDDTQMTICVAEWLLDDAGRSGEDLLARFAAACEPWRRYGPGTEAILRLFPAHRAHWRDLATAAFPHGSLGNGGAMRVAPVGLAFHRDPKRAAAVAVESARTTHSHPQALQGAVLQAAAVATAVGMTSFSTQAFLQSWRAHLARFADLLHDTTPFAAAIDAVEAGRARRAPCSEMATLLGTGVTAVEAVPTALYCFLAHPDSYAHVVREAVFIGGDTDTIAAMAGAISGAYLGERAIPAGWISAVREDLYTPDALRELADRLAGKFGT